MLRALRLRLQHPPWHARNPRCLLGLRCASNARPQSSEDGRDKKAASAEARRRGRQPKRQLSLLEQLFPEEVGRRDAGGSQREIPRLALDVPESAAQGASSPRPSRTALERRSPRARAAYLAMEAQGDGVTVLVLRNASKNLVEEDFRRVIPKGRHIEGWNLEQGDILKVIPGRDTTTLERLNYYYLLFKSPLSAFTYQGHVQNLHTLAQTHVPNSITSPIAPPPGYLIDGEDVHAMLETYALVPSSQKLQLRQLAPPLPRNVETIVRHRGYPSIVSRPARSNVELLLSLEGVQLSIYHIRSAIRESEKARVLQWTGNNLGMVRVTKWEVEGEHLSPMGRRPFADNPYESKHGDTRGWRRGARAAEHDIMELSDEDRAEESRFDKLARRTPAPRYILGFDTEAEAYAFMRHWHRRPMTLQDFKYGDGDMAPIANVELLW